MDETCIENVNEYYFANYLETIFEADKAEIVRAWKAEGRAPFTRLRELGQSAAATGGAGLGAAARGRGESSASLIAERATDLSQALDYP